MKKLIILLLFVCCAVHAGKNEILSPSAASFSYEGGVKVELVVNSWKLTSFVVSSTYGTHELPKELFKGISYPGSVYMTKTEKCLFGSFNAHDPEENPSGYKITWYENILVSFKKTHMTMMGHPLNSIELYSNKSSKGEAAKECSPN